MACEVEKYTSDEKEDADSQAAKELFEILEAQDDEQIKSHMEKVVESQATISYSLHIADSQADEKKRDEIDQYHESKVLPNRNLKHCDERDLNMLNMSGKLVTKNALSHCMKPPAFRQSSNDRRRRVAGQGKDLAKSVDDKKKFVKPGDYVSQTNRYYIGFINSLKMLEQKRKNGNLVLGKTKDFLTEKQCERGSAKIVSYELEKIHEHRVSFRLVPSVGDFYLSLSNLIIKQVISIEAHAPRKDISKDIVSFKRYCIQAIVDLESFQSCK
eukprot:Nk52_evm8s2657 gene=Nk52_evmTU8s2657